MIIKIKPLSVNQCRQGKRFKTPRYKAYEKVMLMILPRLVIPNGPLKVEMTVGFSSKQSDLDNCLKPFLDILQKKYLFNDDRVYELHLLKKIVGKGQEFIDFSIK